jgi:hypothetical protein
MSKFFRGSHVISILSEWSNLDKLSRVTSPSELIEGLQYYVSHLTMSKFFRGSHVISILSKWSNSDKLSRVTFPSKLIGGLGHYAVLWGSQVCSVGAAPAKQMRHKWERLPKHVVLDRLSIRKSMYILRGTVWLDDAANGWTCDLTCKVWISQRWGHVRRACNGRVGPCRSELGASGLRSSSMARCLKNLWAWRVAEKNRGVLWTDSKERGSRWQHSVERGTNIGVGMAVDENQHAIWTKIYTVVPRVTHNSHCDIVIEYISFFIII